MSEHRVMVVVVVVARVEFRRFAEFNMQKSACNIATRLQHGLMLQLRKPLRVQRNATHPFRGVAVLHGAGVVLQPCLGSTRPNPAKIAQWPVCTKPAKFCRQEPAK